MKKSFGFLSTGEEAFIYEIIGNGIRAIITDYGASLVNLYVQDKDGNIRDVVSGYDDVLSYEKGSCYFGATVGRYANRIANSEINIDGTIYRLAANDNENNLHSGPNGTSAVLWSVKAQGEDYITFSYTDPDGRQGFPGTAAMEVTYSLTEPCSLSVHYRGICDKTTPFNMTNHSYFNLNGHASGAVLSQYLQLNCDRYTPVIDRKSIPTGELRPVLGTPFDFTVEKPIGRDIAADDVQLTYGTGYDHNFVVTGYNGKQKCIAKARAEESGITMEVFTDLPGVQLYTGNFIEGQLGKGKHMYHMRDAFCLETQYFPNSINEPAFLRPITPAGELYETTSVYRFGIQ